MSAGTPAGPAVEAGTPLPPFQQTFRTVDLALYGAATWDWHRLHFDLDYARQMGLPNLVVDGQMFGALFARQALDWAGPRGLVTRMSLRMRTMVFAGDTVRGEGEVTALRNDAGHDIAVLAQRLVKGERTAAEATTEVRLPG